MKHQAVSGSYIYLSKANYVNIGLKPIKVTTNVPSDLGPHTSSIWTHMRFIITLSYDLEPDIIMPTSRNIDISADLDPDFSDGLDPGQRISQVFREPLLLNSFSMILKILIRDENWSANCGYVQIHI